MNKKVQITAVSLAFLVGISLTGCSKYNDERGKGDAPVAGKRGDDSPANVTNFPDHFANIATKCAAGAPGYRIFVTTREAPPVVLPDPNCK